MVYTFKHHTATTVGLAITGSGYGPAQHQHTYRHISTVSTTIIDLPVAKAPVSTTPMYVGSHVTVFLPVVLTKVDHDT